MTELLRELEAVVSRMEAIKVANWDVDTAELSATRIAVIDFVHDHHAEIAEAVRDARRYAPCLWIQDCYDGSWDTACGNKHQFTHGDTSDNLYLHCPYCGGRLIEPNDDAMNNSAREVGE